MLLRQVVRLLARLPRAVVLVVALAVKRVQPLMKQV